MRKILKWLGIIFAGLIGLIVVAVIGLVIYGQIQFKKQVNRPVYSITADTSPEGLARGEYLLTRAMSCDEACHTGADGRSFIGMYEEVSDGPIQATFAVPNLTPDVETGLGSWTDGEIARAIREGIDKDGRSLVIMPAYNYRILSDADVAAIIGYLRSLEPVHNEIPDLKVNAIGKVLNALGMFGPSPLGEPITSPQSAPQPGTAENGKYMLALGACTDCHQSDLAGGSIPFASEGSPPSANLTPAGELAGWTAEDFILAVTKGVKPSGNTLHEEMPRYDMAEQDLRDIFMYLQTVPAVSPK